MDRAQPTSVVGVADVAAVSCASQHSCALHGDGTVSCWGDGVSSATAVPIAGLDGIVQLASDADSCALRSDGGVWCWGLDRAAEQLAGFEGVQQIGRGSHRLCAILEDETLLCEDPSAGELESVAGLSGVRQVALGDVFLCALLHDGTVWCRGNNDYGQLGDGTREHRWETPVRVMGLDRAVEVAAGIRHACARRDDGSVWCWGANSSGQLGQPRGSRVFQAAVRVPFR